MFKDRKHKLIFIFSIAIILVLLAKTVLSGIIENKIKDKINNSLNKDFNAQVEKVNFNLFKKSIELESFVLKKSTPDSSLASKSNLIKISFSSLNIKGLNYYDIIINKNILIDSLTVNDLLIETTNKKSKNKINLDSIPIEKISGLKIEKFNFNNVQYTVYDSISNKVLFHHRPVSIDLYGFQLVQAQKGVFKMLPIHENFKIHNIEIDVSSKDHTLYIDEIGFNTETSDISILNLKYLTSQGKFALAKKLKYNESVMDISIDSLIIYRFDVDKYMDNKGIFIDSVLISSALFDIYKDKRKPFNKKIHKKLPHVLLKEMKIPLLVKKVNIEKSLLKLEENFPQSELHLKLLITNMNGYIKNITSIKEFKQTPMTAVLTARLMDKADLKADFKFPLHNQKSTFYFNGSLGKTKFSYFDKVLYPALGLKVIKGDLEHLSFHAVANDYSSFGNMTMLYHNLDATVYKHKTHGKNKLLSWAVTTVLHNSNPVKNKTVRVAELYHKHDKFRGFGGYLWKTLQSGIVNTLSPAGNKTSRKAEEIMLKREKKGKKR